MRKAFWVLPLLAACLATLTGVGAAAAHTRPVARAHVLSGGTWGNARELPGLATLDAGQDAQVNALSCASAGNCAVGGYYTDSSGKLQAFIATKTNGTWGNAEEVPGTAALNLGGYAAVSSVSCASAGNCSAVGFYIDGSRITHVIVVDETNGTWGNAEEIPGSGALNLGGYAGVTSVSCASAGDCSADGFYTDGSQSLQAFVVNEKRGLWGNAEEVLGQSALGPGAPGNLSEVSCGSAGNCATGGVFYPASGQPQAIVVTEQHGTWGKAKEVPGSGALNQGGSAAVNSVSCASAGNCSAGGFYLDGSQHLQAFTVDETSGTWGTAQEVPGSAALNAGGSAEVESVSCASAGNCSAIGTYRDSTVSIQMFTVGETGGTWGNAAEIPGSAALSSNNVSALSVSCGSAGDCGATGFYLTSGGDQAFVVSEAGGTWSNIEPVPGMTTLSPGGGTYGELVSCRSLGHCTAVGDYETTAGQEVFVLTER